MASYSLALFPLLYHLPVGFEAPIEHLFTFKPQSFLIFKKRNGDTIHRARAIGKQKLG